MKIELSRYEILKYNEIHKNRISENYHNKENDAIIAMNAAMECGKMNVYHLSKVAIWKSGRVVGRCKKNTEEEVEKISLVSFSATSERLRIGSLMFLQGVGWPMASSILHFAFPNLYPILDFRAMNTVGGPARYNYSLWEDYTNLCRRTARGHGVTMRELDKALWSADKFGPLPV